MPYIASIKNIQDIKDMIDSICLGGPSTNFSCTSSTELIDRLRRDIPILNLSTSEPIVYCFKVLDNARIEGARVYLPFLPGSFANVISERGQLIDPISFEEIPSDQTAAPRYVPVGQYLMEISSLLKRMLLRPEVSHPLENRDLTMEEKSAMVMRICHVFCISIAELNSCWGAQISNEEEEELVRETFPDLYAHTHNYISSGLEKAGLRARINQSAVEWHRQTTDSLDAMMKKAQKEGNVFVDKLKTEGIKSVVGFWVSESMKKTMEQQEPVCPFYINVDSDQVKGTLNLSPVIFLAAWQVMGKLVETIPTEPEEKENFVRTINEEITLQEKAVENAISKCWKEIIEKAARKLATISAEADFSPQLTQAIGEFEGQKRCNAFLELLHPDVHAYLPAFPEGIRINFKFEPSA